MPIIVINRGEESKFDDIVNKQDMLLRYHSPSCGHCLAMEDEWKSLGDDLDLEEQKIAIVDIDVGIAYTINHPSAKTAISQGVPAIYFIKKNQVFEYSGERKAVKIAEFAISHTNPYQEQSVKNIMPMLNSPRVNIDKIELPTHQDSIADLLESHLVNYTPSRATPKLGRATPKRRLATPKRRRATPKRRRAIPKRRRATHKRKSYSSRKSVTKRDKYFRRKQILSSR